MRRRASGLVKGIVMKQLFASYRAAVIGTTLAVLVATVSAFAGGTVKGSVSYNGNPVVGARVTIDSASNSSYEATALTDKEGLFTFADAPLGGVNVRVYDVQEKVVATAKGILQSEGQVINLTIVVAP